MYIYIYMCICVCACQGGPNVRRPPRFGTEGGPRHSCYLFSTPRQDSQSRFRPADIHKCVKHIYIYIHQHIYSYVCVDAVQVWGSPGFPGWPEPTRG